MLSYIKKYSSKVRCRWTSFVSSRYSCAVWGTGMEFNGNSISSIYADTKLLYKYEHFFSMKTCNLIMNCVPYKHIVLERPSSQSGKVWNQGDFKTPSFPSRKWIGKNMEVQPSLKFKKPIFPSVTWIGKKWEVF